MKNIYYGIILLVFVPIALVSFTFSREDKKQEEKQPNIILITINVLRADHLGCYGYQKQTTPAIDALSRDSFIFENAFAQAGYTMPNMMSILTSLYPDSHKVYDAFKDILSDKVSPLPEILRTHDYKTAWFAPLNVGHLALEAGFGRGFDYKMNLGERLEGREHVLSWLQKQRKSTFFLAINARHTHFPYLPLSQYRSSFRSCGQRFAIETNEEYDEAKYRAILGVLHQQDNWLSKTISPQVINDNKAIFNGEFEQWKYDEIIGMIPPEMTEKVGQLEGEVYYDLVGKTDPDNSCLADMYDGCILATDQEIVKPIINFLKENKIYDDTIIVITGDHGESLGEHNLYGHGMDFYDQIIHVPLLIKPSGKNGQRRKIAVQVESIDIMPTLLDLAGYMAPDYIQGESLVPWMDNNPGRGEGGNRVFGENRHKAYIRSEKWKLIVNREDLNTEYRGDDRLYDLEHDPGEERDAKDLAPAVYQEMRKELVNHLDSLPVFAEREYEFYPHIDEATRERIRQTGYW